MKHTVKAWVYVNKNGFIGMSLDEPKKDLKNGKWKVKYPYVNSLLYNSVKQIVEKTNMNWQSEAEFFETELT